VAQLFSLGIARHTQFMTPYKNISGNSGVTHYQSGDGFIRVRFKNGGTYRYMASVEGADIISTMTDLAVAGRGLSTYIAKHRKQLDPEKED